MYKIQEINDRYVNPMCDGVIEYSGAGVGGDGDYIFLTRDIARGFLLRYCYQRYGGLDVEKISMYSIKKWHRKKS